MNFSKNHKVDSLNKEEIKYLPCLRLLELYNNCLKIKEKNNIINNKDNCNYILITAVVKCGIS